MGLVSPWMDHGTLTHYLKNNSQANRLSLMLDVALGLEYLHSFDPTVIHGDLKGANVLITNDLTACVADFGLCVLAHDSNMQFAMTSSSNGKGSIPWMAPELLSTDTGGQIRKTCASDIYAFGGMGYEVSSGSSLLLLLTLLQIFSGKPPYSDLSPIMIIRAIMENRPLPRPASAELDDGVWGLIEACRGEDPESRPRASEAVQQLRSHPTVRDRAEPVWDQNKSHLLSDLAAPADHRGKLPVPHLI
ncbi:kinase-like protein [Leucogyrophana mollusca]|uniref:Kinase-like protein n=1 Tax=Leucogyrophana mollusca TaxID=85980 RepID=A0ACB8BDS6_9AGAM|nr:kinase-like protein [Leucogyrophana mollusca]